MDLENIKMNSYAVTDLIEDLMKYLHELHKKQPMGMVIDCDIRMPKRLEGDIASVKAQLMEKIQTVLFQQETGILVIRMTYERMVNAGNILVLVQHHPIQEHYEAEKDLTGRTETLVLPQLLVEEGPLVVEKQPRQLIGYYESQQNTDPRARNAYLLTQQHLAKQLGFPLVICGTIQHLQKELRERTNVCLMLSEAQYEVHKDYFSHLSKNIHMIIICQKPADREKYSNQKILVVPFSNLDLADAVIQPFEKRKKPLEAFDQAAGILYCGSEETYKEVLKDYALRGEHNWTKIEELYQTQDWQNYTVEVHGIKSAMKTVGAMETSADAKALEDAGKAEDISYIMTHHEQMMEHFVRDIQSIQVYFSMPVSKRKQGEKLLQNASVFSTLNWDIKELQEKICQLEEAAYAMDKEQMLAIIEQLGNDELLEEARRKIEREDYLSAYEMIAKEGRKYDGICNR